MRYFDTKPVTKRRRDRSEDWQTYEAIITNACFEWPNPIPKSKETAYNECTTYLNQLFGPGRYTLRNFYLKEPPKI